MHLEIRQPLFSGRREVRALWFDLALLGETEARRRVLAHWQAGSQLFQACGGFLLAWPAPRWQHVDALDALALCQVGEVLSSAPLSDAELAALPAGAYWLVRAGVAQAAVPDARVDPAPWLALGSVALRVPLAPPRAPAAQAMAQPMSLQEVLGAAMPERSAESIAFQREFAVPAQGKQDGGGAAMAAAVAGAVLGLLARWFAPKPATGDSGAGQKRPAAPGLLARLFAPKPATGGSGTGQPRPAAPGPLARWFGPKPATGGSGVGQPRPPTPGPLARLLSDWALRMASLTRLSDLLGWRQADYLQKMLDMFAKGDLAQALRHAVPIDAIGGGSARPALGRPRPRTSLTISAPSPAAPAIGLDSGLSEQLRATYRRSFEQLDREGRIDEAVYVLAELLQCGLEAVTYLEKKERYLQAAQLAGTVELAPAVAVRLWVLAGDIERAVQVARLHNDFDAAVRLLESRNSEHAAPLRRHWAEYLAARGDLAEAIDAIWPLPQHHALALAWLVQAERSGGALGMQALARKLALMPGTLRSSAAAIDMVLGAPGVDGVQLRARLAVALLGTTPVSASSRRVAAALLRKVLPERMEGLSQIDKKSLVHLAELAGNAVLSADLPPFSTRFDIDLTPLNNRREPLALRLADRGLMPIQRARALPDGQYLLALGEGGVVRIGRDGRQLAHYPVPAGHLVISHNGKRALALVKRDRKYRVSRLDLISGSVSDWLTLELQDWSGEYDGVSWNVAMERRLAVLDTTAPHQSIVWQVADLPGAIHAYADRAGALTILLRVADGMEQWSYELPGRQLRQRDWWSDIACSDQAWIANTWVLPGPSGAAPYVVAIDRALGKILVRQHGAPALPPVALGLNAPRKVLIDGPWLVLVSEEDNSMCCRVVSLNDGVVRARLVLPQHSTAGFSFRNGRLLMFDQAGRLVDLDCGTGVASTLCLS
ncbi:bpX6 domain-containing protein [Massilia antarctica]|uniref:bpX6 domain-containing protein n=1 Tax=Massilia antarctica TaxID=2765360 RepID=UPI00226E2F92|nr:bpX6 domain-containing protein [Massilia sp. H27-R4]MCY0916071.1 bpX6 domain-containing protein [Massilia sp. H27-R4]